MGRRKGRTRQQKGTVSVASRNGILRLRWTHQGKPYQMSLGLTDTPVHRHLAQGKASEIQADMVYGRFDCTLEKYKAVKEEPLVLELGTRVFFERYIEHCRREGTSGQAIASRYKSLLGNLKRFNQDIQDTDTARAFVDVLRSRQSPRIANQNLSLLKSFGRWCVDEGLMSHNPYTDIKPLKCSRSVTSRKPFTREEVKRFLAAVKTDPVNYRYYDFCYVMLSLGLRPSEAIGLRWGHIDMDRAQVTIRETMARSEDGKTAGYARQRKATKTLNVRTLPLNSRLVAVLQGRKPPESQPDDLVFTTTKGCVIDDHNFRERVWARTCEKAGIDYRPPYTARHTLLSHGIEYEGWSLVQAAQIAGHTSTRMVAETYGHMIDAPKLPEF